MKGLILKDLYMVFKYCKIIYILVAIFSIVAVFDNSTTYWIIFPVVLSSTVSITILAYDERSKWISYSDTLPFTRSQAVSSKYILTILSVGTTWIVLSVIQVISGLIRGNFIFVDYIVTITVVLSLGLISPSLMLPIVFKYGTEKGRIAYYAIVAILVGGGTALGFFLNDTTETHTIGMYALETFIVAIVLIAIFIGSWALSANIYKKREM